MTLVVEIHKDLSLNDLAALHTKGIPVSRSAHVGNLYPANLAIAASGIPVTLFDRNLGYKDKNYHPHGVIRGGVWERLCSDHLMMTHACVERPTEGFPEGQSVAACHLKALQTVFPCSPIVLWADYITQHEELIAALVEIALNECPQLWYRKVHADGTTQCIPRGTSPTPAQIQGKVAGLGGNKTGWVLPNEINILIDAVVGSTSGSSEVHHISGPDMVRYISTLEKQLGYLYGVVSKKLNVPPSLRFCLYPAAAFRFAVPLAKRSALDTLYACVQDYLHGERERGEAFRNIGIRKKVDLQQELNGVRDRRLGMLRLAATECPDVFYNIEDGKYLTQHDLGPNELYVHPEAAALPLSQVEIYWGVLKRYGQVH